jgi:aryl-alcohol dehydrogenase-like predicted oxidoreductase
MEYRNLGQTGIKVSALCLGTMQFGWTAKKETSFTILDAAYGAGINFIDTADIYSRWAPGNPGGVSEEIIGEWMQSRKVPRHQLIVATKVRGAMGEGPNNEGLSRSHIFHAIEASLRRLKTDYIDLYQTHWSDDNTPIDETLAAFDDLIHQGKVRHIGCSNYPAWKLMQSLWVSEKLHLRRFDTLQPHYNLVHRAEFERELADVCRSYHLGVLPYSPLAAGFLTGKYLPDSSEIESQRANSVQHYFADRNWGLIGKLKEIGEMNGGYSISQVALSWLLSDPLITSPIIGPRTPEQLEDNLGCIGLHLPTEALKILNEASEWRSG